MSQQPPKGDARYRVHRSVRCYIAEVRFGTEGVSWAFDESAERVVHLDLWDRETVVYKTRHYPLQPAKRMIEIVETHSRLKGGGVVTVGNKAIYWDGEDREFTPHPFIDLTSLKEHARFRELLAKKAVPSIR
jgi:hypothetical protein